MSEMGKAKQFMYITYLVVPSPNLHMWQNHPPSGQVMVMHFHIFLPTF